VLQEEIFLDQVPSFLYQQQQSLKHLWLQSHRLAETKKLPVPGQQDEVPELIRNLWLRGHSEQF
jgi:hypothetical protein